MRLILAILLSLPAWALSNAVTIQEKSGSTQTNRVVTIPRYFADKEICLNPRPYSGGSAVTYWQSNVKNRWPADAGCVGGYAKFALVTLEIPSVAGSGTYVVEFRSDAAASSAGSALTNQQMLDFDAGGGVASWGAKITTSLTGLTDYVSARDMIGNSQYQVLEAGPLRTSVLVREGPDSRQGSATRATSFGYRCTSLCTAPYATATWVHDAAYNSIRPSFVVTFYSPSVGTGRVEVDNLLDNSWMDRLQDQRFDSLVIYNGAGETNACYTAPSAFVFPARTRIFETCYSATPPALNIDFNKAYVTYSKATPAYSLDMPTGASAVALEVAAFNATDQGATVGVTDPLGNGQTIRGTSAGATSPIIGWVAQWQAHYLASGFDSTLVPVILGNAKGMMHAPYWNTENRTGAYLTGNSTSGFGRVVSIDLRPNWVSTNTGSDPTDAPVSPYRDATYPNGQPIYTSCAAPTGPSTGGCMVTCAAYPNWCSRYASGGTTWSYDLAHSDNEFYIPYLFTGKRVYLEGLWMLAGINLAYFYPQDPPTSIAGRWGKRGLILDPYQTPRGSSWPLRNLGMAAVLSDDGSVEQAYYAQKLNNNLEMHEGRQDIQTGGFPPSNPSCAGFNLATETSIWRMGRCYYDGGATAYGNFGPNPLHFPVRHYFPAGPYLVRGGDNLLSGDGENGPFTEMYWVTTLGWLRDLGYRSNGLHDAAASYLMHLWADPARTNGNPGFAFLDWMAELKPSATGYLQTWASVKAAMRTSTILAKAIPDGTTTTFEMPIYGAGVTDNMDISWRAGTYWKIDNEIIYVPSGGYPQNNVLSVDATTDTVTTTAAHGRADGQLVHIWAASATLDPGMVGNSHCRANYPGGPLNNDCTFYAHVVDSTHLQFFNDAGMTSKVDLQGGGTWYVITSTFTFVTRGALGTIAASHALGATIALWPVVPSPNEDSDPSGGHGFYYLAGLSTAVDYDVTTTAEGNGVTRPLAGQTITARRALDVMLQTVRRQHYQGANVSNCAALGRDLMHCDNPQWSIRPRPRIRNLHVIPLSVSAKFYYTAPDANACKVGVSTTPFASTDDSGDTSDGQKNLARAYTASGLSSGTTYYYRVTCGPSGGAARASGTFGTL